MTQKVQLTKSKRDAALDITSLLVFGTMLYFVLNPEKYDAVTTAFTNGFNRLSHTISVWQTRLSIRSLPETDD